MLEQQQVQASLFYHEEEGLGLCFATFSWRGGAGTLRAPLPVALGHGSYSLWDPVCAHVCVYVCVLMGRREDPDKVEERVGQGVPTETEVRGHWAPPLLQSSGTLVLSQGVSPHSLPSPTNLITDSPSISSFPDCPPFSFPLPPSPPHPPAAHLLLFPFPSPIPSPLPRTLPIPGLPPFPHPPPPFLSPLSHPLPPISPSSPPTSFFASLFPAPSPLPRLPEPRVTSMR